MIGSPPQGLHRLASFDYPTVTECGDWPVCETSRSSRVKSIAFFLISLPFDPCPCTTRVGVYGPQVKTLCAFVLNLWSSSPLRSRSEDSTPSGTWRLSRTWESTPKLIAVLGQPNLDIHKLSVEIVHLFFYRFIYLGFPMLLNAAVIRFTRPCKSINMRRRT